ncbi:MAG: UDP-N-acetylmuramoyl-tripeptide--D-alanyl-D-alanine ligase [Candidatus Shapirobacteria bacterium]
MKKYLLKTLQATLFFLARRIINRYAPEVVAITGSVGKTSTKEAIFAALIGQPNEKIKGVRKSKGNFNNEIGAPLAIIGDFKDEDLKIISRDQPVGTKKFQKIIFWLKAILMGKFYAFWPFKPNYPQILILEYGADKPGDIKNMLSMARPKVAVITAVGEIPAHVEFYQGPEEVAKEKAKILEPLSVNGFAILNFDDKKVFEMKEKTRAKIITFGFDEGADIKISNFENRSFEGKPQGISFKIEYEGNFVPVFLKNVLGRAQAYASAAAFAVGVSFGLNIVEIADSLERNYYPPKRRTNILEGIKKTFVIDDSYNASPLSVREALEILKSLEAKRKVAVLGDMLELGEFSIEAHQKIGKIAGQVADVLITAGPRAKFIAEKAKAEGLSEDSIYIFDSATEVCEKIKSIIKEGDLILVKASRSIGLDKVVEELRSTINKQQLTINDDKNDA